MVGFSVVRTPKRAADQGKPSNRSRRGLRANKGPVIILGVLLLFLIGTYAIVLNAIRPHSPGRELTLDALEKRVRERQITEVTLNTEDSRAIGHDDRGDWWVGLANNEILTNRMLAFFTESGVSTRINTQTSKSLLKLSTSFLLPTATLVVGFAFLYTLFRGPGGNKELAVLGRSKARRYSSGNETQVTFADVAGLEEAVEELKEVKDFLAAPERFEAMGARPPRGVLLLGPPGCGKTLLAKAVAGEAGVPFFSISASEFLEILVGVGPSRVRDLFAQARAAAPSIIFIDEIDAVGRSRASGDTINPEGESTLNELLVQLDGFDPSSRVVLMAATNRPEILDQALVRKGRFDRQVVIDVPDLAGRVAIARVHAKGKPLASDLDLERFARRAVGLTGADIAAALNEAATLATRRRLPSIGRAELDDAVERVLAGPERRSRVLDAEDKQRVAYHEAAHALVGWVMNSLLTVDKVSIVARGHNLGSTLSLPIDDRRLKTRSQMQEELAYILAGRAGEQIVFSDMSGGSQSDLNRAANMAHQMVFELGMTESLGPVVLGPGDGRLYREHSEEIAQQADREMRRVLEEADAQARVVLQRFRPQLDRLAEQLVTKETLERADLEALLGDVPTGAPEPATAVSGGPSRPTAFPS
jgi:cell division protease FtsH